MNHNVVERRFFVCYPLFDYSLHNIARAGEKDGTAAESTFSLVIMVESVDVLLETVMARQELRQIEVHLFLRVVIFTYYIACFVKIYVLNITLLNCSLCNMT